MSNQQPQPKRYLDQTYQAASHQNTPKKFQFDRTTKKDDLFLKEPIREENQHQNIISSIQNEIRSTRNTNQFDIQRVYTMIDSKQIEIEKLQNQISQFELRLQSQQSLETNNKKLNEEIDQVEAKYGQLLNEYSHTVDECEQWRCRTGKLELMIQELNQVTQELGHFKARDEENLDQISVLKHALEERDQHINQLKQAQQGVNQSQSKLEILVKGLEEQLISNDKAKNHQISQLTNQQQQQLSKIGVQYKQELNLNLIKIERQEQQIQQQFKLNNELQEKLKVKDQLIQDRDAQYKLIRREYESLQSKLSQREDDYQHDLRRLKKAMDEKINQLQDECEEEKILYKQHLNQFEDVIQKVDAQKLQQQSDSQVVISQKQELIKENDILKSKVQDYEIRMTNTENNHTQQTALQTQLHTQEVQRLREQMQLLTENLRQETQNLQQKLSDKEKQLKEKETQLKQQQQLKEKEKQQHQLLQKEMNLYENQVEEMQNQKELEMKYKDQVYEEKLTSINHKLEQVVADSKSKMHQLSKMLEQKEDECQNLLICKNETNMKLNDIQKYMQHLKVENEQLKQTIASLQQQKLLEDDAKDEVRKRDIQQLKQYHETISDQMEYEVKGLSALLDQKTKECEEWRSCYLRLRK